MNKELIVVIIDAIVRILTLGLARRKKKDCDEKKDEKENPVLPYRG